jgi:hypothetical protein
VSELTDRNIPRTRHGHIGPFEEEECKERDGLLFDTGDFCAIFKDETTAYAQEIIKLSNLSGSPFLIFDDVYPEGFLRSTSDYFKKYVAIGELIIDQAVLGKLLKAIDSHNVEFYKIETNQVLGIKAIDRTGTKIQKAIIFPLKPPQSEVSGEQSEKEIPTLKEALDYYNHNLSIKPRFSLEAWAKGEAPKNFSLRGWAKEADKSKVKTPST